jgi:hypothetical protein
MSMLLAPLALATAACGGNVAVGSNGAGGGHPSTTTGTTTTGATTTGTTTTGGGGASGGCPAAEPSGGPCATAGLRCTYGDSVRPECRSDWTCSGGAWTTTKGVCIAPPPGHCPDASPAGASCGGRDGDVCTYGTTLCVCSQCPTGPCMAPPPKWSCAAAPAGACPPSAPNDGTPCDAPGAHCSYGFPCGGSGAVVDCKDGRWTWDPQIACPN